VQTVETNSFLIEEVLVSSSKGPIIKTFDDIEIRIKFTGKVDIREPGLYIGICTLENQRIAGLDFRDFQTAPLIHAGETVEMGFRVTEIPFLPGDYELELHLKDMAEHRIEIVPRAYPFQVAETPIYGARKLDSWFGHVGLNAVSILKQNLSKPDSCSLAACE
jgi:hypothetical protein